MRAKTTYYNSIGVEGIDIEIDIDGNTSIKFPTTTTQINIEELTALAELTLKFKNLTINPDVVAITSTTSASIDSAKVELGSLASAVKTLVISDVLQLLTDHVHPYTDDGSPMVTSPSATLIPLPLGAYETAITKAN